MNKLAIAVVMSLAGTAFGQVSYVSGTYSQNFDTLTAASPTPFSATVGTLVGVPGVPGWFGTRLGGTSTSALPWTVSDGSVNTGSLYSFGVTSASDRALGSLASGGQIPGFGVEIVNNGVDIISEFTITFDGEQYRSSTSTATPPAPNLLAFAWGVTGGGATSADFVTSASMTLNTLGDIVGQAPVATNGVIPPVTLATYSVTITGLNVAVGQSIFLRWQDANDLGNDAGLAIDNFNFTATFVPTPGAAALLGLGTLVASRRRRA